MVEPNGVNVYSSTLGHGCLVNSNDAELLAPNNVCI